jgi:hypothetical protein
MQPLCGSVPRVVFLDRINEDRAVARIVWQRVPGPNVRPVSGGRRPALRLTGHTATGCNLRLRLAVLELVLHLRDAELRALCGLANRGCGNALRRLLHVFSRIRLRHIDGHVLACARRRAVLRALREPAHALRARAVLLGGGGRRRHGYVRDLAGRGGAVRSRNLAVRDIGRDVHGGLRRRLRTTRRGHDWHLRGAGGGACSVRRGAVRSFALVRYRRRIDPGHVRAPSGRGRTVPQRVLRRRFVLQPSWAKRRPPRLPGPGGPGPSLRASLAVRRRPLRSRRLLHSRSLGYLRGGIARRAM